MNLTDIVKINSVKLEDKAVTNAKIRDSVGLSVIGRTENTTGQVSDIVAATNKHVLRRNGNNIGFGTIEEEAIANGAITGQKLSGAQTGIAPVFGIRSFVNFNGTGANGSKSILEGGNIASVFKNGTGDFTVTFGLGINGDYICFGGVSDSPAGGTINFATKTPLTIQVKTYNAVGTLDDFAKTYVAIIS